MTKTEELETQPETQPETQTVVPEPEVSFLEKHSELIIKILMVIVIVAIGYSLLTKNNKVVSLGLQSISGGSIDYHFADNF